MAAEIPATAEIMLKSDASKQFMDTLLGQGWGVWSEGLGGSQATELMLEMFNAFNLAGEAANAAEMKAAATGNELIFLQVKLASELKKMEAVYANFQRSRHQLERRVATLEKYPEQAAKESAGWAQEIELRNQNTTQEPYFAVNGRLYGEKNRGDLLVVVGRAMKDVLARPEQAKKVGLYRGFQVHVEAWGQGCQFVLEGRAGLYNPLNLSYKPGDEFSIHGFIQRLDNFMDKFETRIEEGAREKDRKAAELVIARQSLGQSFSRMAELEILRQDNRAVLRELQTMQGDPAYKSSWRPVSGKFKERGQEQAEKPVASEGIGRS